MIQAIVGVEVRCPRLSHAEAAVEVLVKVADPAEPAELRGRLTGPRCPGTHTLEVTYPLRPKPSEGFPNPVVLRCVIPDPTFATDLAPHVYEGVVELVRGGAVIDSRPIAVSFRGE